MNTMTSNGPDDLPAEGPHTVQSCQARSALGIDCRVVVVGPFLDAPEDDLSVGEFAVIAPCNRIASTVWDGCDAYGIDYDRACSITPHH